MKRVLLTAAALSVIAGPAFAQSAPAQVDINANVAEACGIGNAKGGWTVNPDWNQDDITVVLADGNGQFGGITFSNRSFGNVWCNTTADVTIEVGSLVNGARNTPQADAGSFTNEFNLRVTTGAGVYVSPGVYTGLGYGSDSGANPLVLNTTGVGVRTISGSTLGAFETGLAQYSGFHVDVLADANGRRPIAGDYEGYISFTATAQ